jgi:hypothetical protein
MIDLIKYFGRFLPEYNNSIIGIMALLVTLLVLVVIILFIYRGYLIKRSSKKEYWLPIVDDGASVIGRVARSVSLEKPGTYQHPLIRILTLKSGAIYLSPRTNELSPDFGKYDHPFERMMEYGLSVEETLESMKKKFFPRSQTPGFLLKYKHINEIGQWQVLLFVLNILDESELIGLDKCRSKFWTIRQIRENIGKSYFSSFLEGEIDFLEALKKT